MRTLRPLPLCPLALYLSTIVGPQVDGVADLQGRCLPGGHIRSSSLKGSVCVCAEGIVGKPQCSVLDPERDGGRETTRYGGAGLFCKPCFAMNSWINLWISLFQPLPEEHDVPALVFQRRVMACLGTMMLCKLLYVDHVFIPSSSRGIDHLLEAL